MKKYILILATLVVMPFLLAAGLTTVSSQRIVASVFSGGQVTGAAISGGSITALAISGVTIATSAITGGTINGAAITGGSLANASITNPSMSGGSISSTAISNGSITGASISGGNINNTPISGSTGSFTSVNSSGTVTGPNFTGVAAQASQFDHTPNGCPGGQFANTIAANGDFGCGSSVPTTTMAFPSRSFSTTYTNGGSRLEVSVTGNCTCNVGHFSQITAFVNGAQVTANGTTNGGGLTSVVFVVPPGGTYSVTFNETSSSGGTLTLAGWTEWNN